MAGIVFTEIGNTGGRGKVWEIPMIRKTSNEWR